MNAIAVLVLLALSLPLLGIGTALLVWTVGRRRPRWLVALIALIAGTAVHPLAARLLPGADLGPAVDAIACELPIFDAWAALRDEDCREFLLRNALAIAGTGAAMALVGVLESIMVVRALDQQFGDRSDTRRELACIGSPTACCRRAAAGYRVLARHRDGSRRWASRCARSMR